MHELDFVRGVCCCAEGYFACPVAGADEMAVGEGGAFYDVFKVRMAHEAVFAREFVDELDGGIVRGTYC